MSGAIRSHTLIRQVRQLPLGLLVDLVHPVTALLYNIKLEL
jgi:hypothetical protein